LIKSLKMAINGAHKGTQMPTSRHSRQALTAALAPPPDEKEVPLTSFGYRQMLPQSVYDKVFTAEDKKPIKFTIKKGMEGPTQTHPGNWQESVASQPKLKHPPGLINAVDSKIAAAFPTGKPFGATPELVNCKQCKKPIYKMAASGHIKECLKKKQEKLQRKKVAKEAKDAAARKERNGGVSPAQSVDETGNSKTLGSARKSAKDGADVDGVSKKTSKKRKADDDGKGPSAKKKKKDEPKPKTAKPKGPVDVEKQCGVLLPNNSMCARSLTCKSHSMGAKRAVPGRSMPYDVLLAQYQKKNQAKLQSKCRLALVIYSRYTLTPLSGAAMDANAPLADDFEPQGTVDSDEERDTVMASISRYYRQDPFTGGRTMGRPLSTFTRVPVRRRYNHIRLKGSIKQAIEGVHGAKLFATPATLNSGMFGALANGESSSMSETFDVSRRPSAIGGARQLPSGPRKPSIS
jgi:SAGA-associated factor 73